MLLHDCRTRFDLRGKWFRLALLLALLGATYAGAAGKPHPDSKRNVKHEIEALEEQWRSAQIAGDIPALDRLMSEDFIGISITGQANTKEQQLDRIRRRTLVLTKVDLADQKIKLVGPVAIVTSLAYVEGTNEGESMKGTFRYTRVYQRLASGAWKTTNFEATRVPADRRER